jgi:hypothetical protein
MAWDLLVKHVRQVLKTGGPYVVSIAEGAGKLAEPNGNPYRRGALGRDDAGRPGFSHAAQDQAHRTAKSGPFGKKPGELRRKASLKKGRGFRQWPMKQTAT